MNRLVLFIACGCVLSMASSSAIAEGPLTDALTQGEVNVDLRYRFELVDEEGFAQDAEASTLRLRLGYETGSYHGVFARVEVEALETIGSERYNSTANGLAGFPVVADPEDGEINQGYIGYSGVENTMFTLGRQRIALDNHRFIGNVGWRQLEQTFDAFAVKSDVRAGVALFYAHLDNANRIFGAHHPDPVFAESDLSGDLVNVSIASPIGTLTGYAYLLEFQDAPASSHKDLGVRLTGERITDGVVFLYTAEFADQSDYEGGASSVDATYLLGEAGIELHGFTLKLGYEQLGGDGTYGFQTPLATLHAMNGWADKFLSTPPAGLEDLSFSVATTVRGVKIVGAYHDFSADEGGDDYGTELDLAITRKFKEIYTVGAKYASYDAGSLSTDTDKLWLWFQVSL